MWNHILLRLRRFTRVPDEGGQGLAEYGLVIILVGIIVVVVLTVFGETLRNQYCEIVYTFDAEADMPVCETFDVTCSVLSTSPFRMEAVVGSGVEVEAVKFYVDGKFQNQEVQYHYCLGGGNGPCDAYTNSGTHRFSAVAFATDGTSGQCSITYDIP